MGWKLFQLSIVAAAVLSNVAWRWTDNHYAPAVLGIGIAWIATIEVSNFNNWSRRWLSRLVGHGDETRRSELRAGGTGTVLQDFPEQRRRTRIGEEPR